jgi:small GTP-binding protein
MGNNLTCNCWSNQESTKDYKEIEVPNNNPTSIENFIIDSKNNEINENKKEIATKKTISAKVLKMKEEEEKKQQRGANVSQKEGLLNIYSPQANNKDYKKSSKRVLNYLDEKQNNKFINILVLGDTCGGKTSLIYKLTSNIFETYHIPTIKVEIIEHKYAFNGNTYNLNFIDTCGLAEYRSESEELYTSNNIDVILLIVDLSDNKNFEYMKELIKSIITKHKKIIVLGNKFDLLGKNKENRERIVTYASSKTLKYFDVSAKTGNNLLKVVKACVGIE